METITGTLTTGEWIVAGASAAILLLSLVPLIWACWMFVAMSDKAVESAIDDAERRAKLKEQVTRGDFSRPIADSTEARQSSFSRRASASHRAFGQSPARRR